MSRIRASRAIAAACAVVIAVISGQVSAQPASVGKVLVKPALGDASILPNQQDPSCEKIEPTLDPSLSPDWLRKPPTPGAKPSLVIGYYNLSKGLLAGYEAANGRRILLQSVWIPNGRVAASATHVNSQTGRLQTFYGPRKQGDPSTGKVAAHIQFAGVNVMEDLTDARTRGPAPRADAVNDFIDSESGQAFFEAVPVLYAVLELMETDPNLGALQAPFGVLVTGLQIATTKYAGFAQANSTLGAAHANELRNACHGGDCAFSGKRFVIHKNGLFDVVSKSKGPQNKRALGQCIRGSTAAGPFGAFAAIQKNGDGNCTDPGECFGRCGRGCEGQAWAGNHYTAACWAHDLCVCMWSDSDCYYFESGNPPYGNCPGCGDLFDAVLSWLGEIFYDILDWLMGGDDPDINMINFP